MNSDTIFLSRAAYEDLQALKEENRLLKAELAEIRRLVFGRTSERHIPEKHSGQTELEFGGMAEEPEVETEEIQYRRRKPSRRSVPGGITIEGDFPVERVVLEPEEDVTGMKKVREETTRVLEHLPAKFYWIEYVRSIYAPATGIGSFVKAQLPFRPIEKGLPGPQFTTRIVVDKYVDHIPVYRQIKRYSRLGVTIPDSTMDGWIGKYAALLTPLYELAREEVMATHYVQADETTLRVLQHPNKSSGKSHLGYLVPYHAPLEKMVFFEYMPYRNQRSQVSLLAKFKGCLQTDGHNCYNRVAGRKDIVHAGCMYHARRKFERAFEADKEKAEYALRIIRLLSEIEKRGIDPHTQGVDYLKRQRLRMQRSNRLMRIFKKWLETHAQHRTPTNLLTKAINYVLKRWDELSVFLDDGRVEISNNLIENLIRPVAVGRKNWLFSGSPAGAKRAAIFFTIFAGCKLNDINPYDYLLDVVLRINDHKMHRLSELLPWNWKPSSNLNGNRETAPSIDPR